MLIIKKPFLEEMIKQCILGFPNEACGILSGSGGQIEKVYAMTNIEKSPATYFMDAKEQLKVIKEIRALGQEMLAIYHSHPDTQAYPSAHDVELALYPEASYIIISLESRDEPVVRSFKIVESKVKEEELKVC
jgi:proteasome lid subunit RPN8/RPN11